MVIFDAHTHIQFPVFDGDRDEVIARAREAGVGMICVGTQAATSESAIELAKKYPEDIWATVGFHPNHLYDDWYHDKQEQSQKEPEKFNIEKLKALAKNEGVVAIGECGLDYHRLATSDKRQETRIKERQKEVFIRHIELSREINEPLMIHCRSAFPDLISTLVAYRMSLVAPLPGVIHFFSGTTDDAGNLLDLGFYFTFGGVITFARDYDEQIKMIPLERILLETDAPYVAPKPYRGKRNEPAYIVETAKKMAELKGVEYDKILEITTANVRQVFGI